MQILSWRIERLAGKKIYDCKTMGVVAVQQWKGKGHVLYVSFIMHSDSRPYADLIFAGVSALTT